MVNEIIVDASALVEYAFATEKGLVAKEIIENKENVILIPSIVIGELTSKLERSGMKDIEQLVNNLGEYSIAVPVNWKTCLNAGKIHAKLRKIERTISLVDCIVIVIAEEHGNALILTCDPHFKHYKNVKLL